MKAHIECSKGIPDHAFLAACLQRIHCQCSNKTSIVQEANEWLQTLISKIFSPDNMSIKETIETLKEQIKVQMEGNDFTILPPSTLKADGTADSSSSTSAPSSHQIWKAMNKIVQECPINWDRLSVPSAGRIKGLVQSIVSEICNTADDLSEDNPTTDCDENNANSIDETAWIHVFYIIGIIEILESINVKTISYSSLPICHGGSNNDYNSRLLLQLLSGGMSVNVHTHNTSSNDPHVDISCIVGVAILKVLTTTVYKDYQANKSSFSDPSFILQGIGSGIDKSNDRRVSVFFGETGTDSSKRKEDTNKEILSPPSLWNMDNVTQMEANLDDTTGENLAFVIEQLMCHGAIDAWATPIVMKKGRPGHTLHCLCMSDDKTIDSLLEMIFRQSTTLGIRIYRKIPRAKLFRSMTSVKTRFNNDKSNGVVSVKISKFSNGEIVSTKAEFDDCKRIATEVGVPLKLVAHEAVSIAEKTSEKRNGEK
jgi:hypothetical protein